MATYLEVMKRLSKIPGVGRKLAERITFYLLENDVRDTNQLLEKIKVFVNQTHKCKVCGLISKNNPCNICSSSKRNQKIICIVKSIQDALTIERSGIYDGLYHVLGKLLSPIDNIYEKDLKVENILKRISSQTKEIIFALENNQASNMTAGFIIKKIREKNQTVNYSHIAIGVPIGISLEYVDPETIKSSILNRFSLKK